MTDRLRTLILCRPDRVGDVVISTSCLAPVREKYPDAKIYFAAAEQMRPLLEGHPLLAGFIPLAADVAAAFQRLQASAIVHLHPDAHCYWSAPRAEIPVRIGYAAPSLGSHLTHKIPDRRKAGLKHEAEYLFDLLAMLDVTPPKKLHQNVQLSEPDRHSLERKLPWPLGTTPYAVLNPSAHSKIARWPIERFLRLADRLQNEFGLLPVFTGLDARDSIPPGAPRHLNLAGKTNLGELGWLLKHARVLVTAATGPSHLAAAAGCPVVTIFGRTAPLYGPIRWRPLSDKTIIVTTPLRQKTFERRESWWRRCFAAIEVGQVAQAVQQALKIL